MDRIHSAAAPEGLRAGEVQLREGSSEATAQTAGRRVRAAQWCERHHVLPLIERLRRWRRGELRILAYHRVLDVPDANQYPFDIDVVSASVDGFRRQMQLVAERCRPLTLAAVADLLDAGEPLPPGAVVVTFDDGYDDNLHHALPVLRETGVPATFFVSTGHIDNGLPYAYDWLVHLILSANRESIAVPAIAFDQPLPQSTPDRREFATGILNKLKLLPAAEQNRAMDALGEELGMPRKQPHPGCRPMSWDQVRELAAADMEIGSHGVSHSMLSKMDKAGWQAELTESRDRLQQELGKQAVSISYPVGGWSAVSREVLADCRSAGYRIGCSYISGTNRASTMDRFMLHRLPVEVDMDHAWFAAMLSLPEVFCYPTPDKWPS